jgi:hypothetical protein
LQRVGARCLGDGNRHCRQLVQIAQNRVVIDAQFDAREVAQAVEFDVMESEAGEGVASNIVGGAAT